MKVLWLSNVLQTERPASGSGVWLSSMANGLLGTGEVELGNIAFGPVEEVTRRDMGSLRQWAVPSRLAAPSALHNALPPVKDLDAILSAIEEFNPDVVHVWGAENFWGLMTARGLVGRNAMLEMQGVRSAIAKVFYGDLSMAERVECASPLDILRRATLWDTHRKFVNWMAREGEIIRGHRFIVAHSPWLAAHVSAVNPDAEIIRENLVLRDEFYRAESWQFSGRPTIFCSAAYPAPFKGLHVAIRALAHVVRQSPDAELRIAGARPGTGVRREGYMAWVARLAARLGVARNVTWLGQLTGQQIVAELRACSAMVIPTFIEGYCTALAESMAVGVPTVVSYVGGTPSLAADEESALFVAPGDDVMLAFQVSRLLRDRTVAERMSQSARQRAASRHDREGILRRKLEAYARVSGRMNSQAERVLGAGAQG